MTLKVDNIQNENASEANVVLNSNGSISIPSQIKHVGDDNTLIEFETDTIKLQTNGSPRVVAKSDGKVGIGTDAPATTLEVEDAQAELQVQSTSGTNSAGLRMIPGGQTNALYIYADGTRNICIDDHSTGRLKIQSDGDLSITDGNLVLAAGHGIDFSNQTATSATGATTDSELLDHYEEGTWTPVPRFGGTSHILTGSFNGNYTRIGDKVEARFRITFTAKGTSTGAFTVEGLPFATNDSLLWTNSGFGFLHRTNLPQSAGQVTADVSGAVINFRLAGLNSGNTAVMDDADLIDSSDIRGSVCYKVST